MQRLTNLRVLTMKVLFTISLLVLSRVGVFIPISGLDHNALYQSVAQNGLINFLNLISGGSFSTLGVFALGIGPYINASIIVQALSKTLPVLQKLKEEGNNGYKKIIQITRYLSIVLSVIQSIGIITWIRPYVFDWNISFVLNTMITLITGAAIIMWLAELITEKGIGNGQSLLICQNIVASIANSIWSGMANDSSYTIESVKTSVLAGISFLIMGIITTFIQEAKRNIILVSTRQLGKDISVANYLPLKFNYLGVMPLIISSTILNYVTYQFSGTFQNSILYIITYYILIISFSYIQSFIVLDPDEISQNLKKMGTSIPSVRPGKETTTHVKDIINRLTFLGANYLCVVACIPAIISKLTNISIVKGIGVTTLFILINVTVDTIKEVKAYKISQLYQVNDILN